MALDPTAIIIDSHATPVWQQEPESFQDIMAEQLRHAPWLVLSAALHALGALLLFLLLPAAKPPAEQASVMVILPQDQPLPPPPKPIPPEPTPQEPIDPEPTLNEPVLDDQQTDDISDVDLPPAPTPSAHDSNQWATQVGMGGCAAGPYGERGGGGRRGGRPLIDRTIKNGLDWLARHQDEDGKWDCDDFMKHDASGDPCTGPGNGVHDVGVTGLALLAFLGDGSTMRAGTYKDNIKRGVKWLRANQQDNGLFGQAASNDFVYGHAIAAYAMCEAYGLSNYSSLRKTAQMSLNYLESHRNPYSVWRYQPRDNDNDTSVTGWCIMAYESGKYFGLQVNDAALKLCGTYLDSVTDATGRAGYREAGEPSSRHHGDHMTRFPTEKGEAMTAVALFSRFFLHQDPDETPAMGRAAELLAAKPPVWDEGTGAIDHYYWYYGTYAMYQVGGRHWTNWSKKVDSAVVSHQRKDGNFLGSWDPVGVWGDDGGRVYSTAMLTLTLEAYHRYTKLIR